LVSLAFVFSTTCFAQDPAKAPAAAPVSTVPGMPPVADPANLYSETTSAKVSPALANDLPRVYVPHIQSNDVYVIDPATFKVVDKFNVGLNPQHVVPSWDLRTLWVANNAENTTKGSLTPVDPKTGKPGKPVAVDDPYNMYFSPDGKSAIVVAEAMKRLDFRDPVTMKLQYSIPVPLRRHQPRRLLDRRQVRNLHLRVFRHRREDRPREPQGARLYAGDPAWPPDQDRQGT
jgi:YVTN family beta-propeller protein